MSSLYTKSSFDIDIKVLQLIILPPQKIKLYLKSYIIANRYPKDRIKLPVQCNIGLAALYIPKTFLVSIRPPLLE